MMTMARPKQKDGAFLASYLPYLLNRVAREMLKGVDEKFAQRGLNVPKWRILAVLNDKGVCRFGELVDLTSTEPATLSRFVGSLADEGLVRRERSDSDARVVDLALTPRGQAVFLSTLDWAYDTESRITRGLSKAEIKVLKSLLDTLYQNVRDGEFADLNIRKRRKPVQKPLTDQTGSSS